MKLNTAVIISGLALASVSQADIIKRRPHEEVAHRRNNNEYQNYVNNFQGHMSAMLDALSPSDAARSSDGSRHRNAAVASVGNSTSSSAASLSSVSSGSRSSHPSSSSSSHASQPSSQSSQSSQSSNSSSSRPHSSSSSSSRAQSSSSSDSNNDNTVGGALRSSLRHALNRAGFGWIGSILGGDPYEYTNPDDNRLLANKPKLGISWANGDSFNISDFITQKVSWYYTWDDKPNLAHPPTNITFCPMLWGHKNVNSFRANVLHNPDGPNNSGKCVLGMNEVNQKGQADMTPEEGCNLMRDNVIPLKQHGYYIVSPVTTNAPNGIEWMDQFRGNCSDVFDNIDAMALHYYDTNATNFREYVNRWHDRYNRPIWVTEYACQDFNGGPQCSQSQTNQFQVEMAHWFDQQDFIEAYAPFGVMRNMQGVDNSNRLTNNDRPNTLYDAISNVPSFP